MKIFLANLSCREGVIDTTKCLYSLETFFGLEKKKKTLEKIKNKTFNMFLLDSGAYTFMAKQKKGKSTRINWYEYLESYIKFINKYDIEYFFELDIDSIVGYDEVLKLRKILEDGTGKKCIPVWHDNRGREEFLKMCDEYDYVAIGGMVTGKISAKKFQKFLPWFIKEAHKRKTKVHGLGFTSINGIKKIKFDSVDSTSWLSGGRFGHLYLFSNGELKSINIDNKRIKNYVKADTHNLNEWVKIQKYADKFL